MSASEESFFVEGILVASNEGEVRLLIDQLAIDLDENDVVSAEELPAPPHLRPSVAQLVRLELQRGARLLRLSSGDVYGDVICERGQLFAVRTRREEQYWRASEHYRRLEAAFLARFGIAVPGEEQ